MQIVQEVLESNAPADLVATLETTDVEFTERCRETMVTVRHAQTQVIIKPGITHEGRQTA